MLDPMEALAESHRVQRLVTNLSPTLNVPDAVKSLRCAH